MSNTSPNGFLSFNSVYELHSAKQQIYSKAVAKIELFNTCLDEVGLSKSYLSELENGVRPMTLKTARKLEERTKGDLKAADLLGFTQGAA